MDRSRNTAARLLIALALGTALVGCSTADPEHNSSLYSVHQPVVEHSNYALDLPRSGDRLAPAEQRRLATWFDALQLSAGDRVSVSDAMRSPQLRADIAAVAVGYGVQVEDVALAIEGPLEPGLVRVAVNRAQAYVPGCPDWSDRSDSTLRNTTSRNFGCAINSNLAAMVADPDHLIHGADDTGSTTAMSAAKAIATYQQAEPTGAQGLPQVSSRESGQ